MQRKNYKVDAVTLRRNVGWRVRSYRDRLSQRAFAKQLGITQAYLCRVERGEVDVSLIFLQKMVASIETQTMRGGTITGESLSDFLKNIEDKDQDAYKWIKPEPKKPDEPTAEEDPLTPEEEAAEDAKFERMLRDYGAQQAAQAEREVSAEKSKEHMERIISAGRKAVAKTVHPDVGGSHEEMRDVNAAAQQLLQQINKA